MGRILAIDFGLKRCGLAVTDEAQLIASALAHITSIELDSYLSEYIGSNQVDSIILGLPRGLDGQDTDITQNVLLLKSHLELKFPDIEVHTMDERFTSKMAQRSMLQMGMAKKKRKIKGVIDEISAVMILQDYMAIKARG